MIVQTIINNLIMIAMNLLDWEKLHEIQTFILIAE